MSERLPLFPLGTVLLPGLVLPLHVFEERYRTLVQDLLALPEDERRVRRRGHPRGPRGRRRGRHRAARRRLHRARCGGCSEHPDGRYDLVTVGERRFRLGGVSHERPYLVGDVEWLPDEVGDADEARLLAAAVRARLRRLPRRARRGRRAS